MLLCYAPNSIPDLVDFRWRVYNDELVTPIRQGYQNDAPLGCFFEDYGENGFVPNNIPDLVDFRWRVYMDELVTPIHRGYQNDHSANGIRQTPFPIILIFCGA